MPTALETATLRLKQLCPEGVPELLDVDYTDALAAALRYTTRAASTAYTVGAVVVPAASNERTYRCVVAGTTGATLPAWPDVGASVQGYRITDGTVTWEDAGPAFASPYDVEAAARECWRRKAQLCVGLVDSSDGSERISYSQIYRHCMAQASLFEGTWVA